LSESEWKRRLEVGIVQRELREALGRRFLKGNTPIDVKNVNAFLSEVLAAAATTCKTLTHFIPCHLSSDAEPSKFEIGPVCFQPTASFLEEHQANFERYVLQGSADLVEIGKKCAQQRDLNEPLKHAIKHYEALATGARAWFSQFGWVAAVTIHRCDAATSRTRAERATETALNILRLMLGTSYGDRIRMDNHPMRPTRSASLTQNEQGQLDVTLHWVSPAGQLGGDWWKIINAGDNTVRIATAGRLINTITLLEPYRPLCERLIDALEWFGRGVAGTIPGARVVDYVTAIERVTLCPDERPTRTISTRACILCSHDAYTLDEAERRKIKHLYKLRSGLVHGSLSPFEPEMESAAYNAEKVAATTIMRAIDLYKTIGAFSDNANLDTLKAAYEHIESVARKKASSAGNR